MSERNDRIVTNAAVVELPTVWNGELSEDTIATIFENTYANTLRYCHTKGKWYIWKGTHWQKDETKEVFNLVRKTCRKLGRGNAKLTKASTTAAVERYVQAAPCFAVTSEVWNPNPWLLGTPDGTVDLKTGVLRDAKPTDYITRITAVAPAEPGNTPKCWLKFLEEATQGDQDLIDFLQQVAGYALTGETQEQALFFIYGGGGNGKSICLNTICDILKGYAQTAAMDTFTASRYEKHPTDLAHLQGARLVTASETERGRQWAEARIKQLTGGDPVSARFMRQDFFTYTPAFKLIITGNHKPRLGEMNDAITRRINIIPFTHRPSHPDKELANKLRQEWPEILRWMIDGCLDWQKNGLKRPTVVLDATREYIESQDIFGQWINDCCDIGNQHTDTHKALFKSWEAYANKNGELPGSGKAFTGTMENKGFKQQRKNFGSTFEGVRVKPSPRKIGPHLPDDSGKNKAR